MNETVLCYLSVCLFSNVILYITKGFKGIRELKMICSLLMICTILLPLVKSFPNIITDFDLSNIKTDTEISEYDFEAIENRITDYTEESVAQLIEHEFDVKVTVIVKIDFSDIEAIKLNEIRVYTDNTKSKEEMYLLLKNTYFCEVFIYEKK